MTTITKKIPARALWFRATEPVQLLASEGGEKQPQRQFSMLVHTGVPVRTYYWGTVVVDLDGIQFKQRLPALLDHDTRQRVGFTTSIKAEKKGVVANGILLSNEFAQQVINDADEGYPWQASCYLAPERVEEVGDGVEFEVNGQTLTGPAYVFRQCVMREVTFTALGADDNTTAEAFAAGEEIEVDIQRFEDKSMKPKIKTPAAPADETAPNGVELSTQTAVAVADAETVDESKVRDAVLAEERNRIKAIRAAADPEQTDLVQSLIDSGANLQDAVLRLNADMRERLKSARSNQPSDQGLPLGAGDGDTRKVPATAGLVGLELWKDQWQKDAKLRREFDSENVWLAFAENEKRTHAIGMPRDLQLSGSLQSLGYRNVVGTYFLALQERTARSWVPQVASMFTTDQLVEVYKWIQNAPALEKWQGERKHQQLADFGLQVIGDKFTSTITVDIDDVRRDKTGLIMERVRDLAGKVATLPQRLISQVINNNVNAHDGAALFGTTRTVGKSGTINNDITVSGAATPDAPTSAFFSDAILSGVQQLFGFNDDQGDPINEEAGEFLVMVPTKYWKVTQAALALPFTSAGVSNLLPASGVKITAAVNPRMNGTAAAAGRRIAIFRVDAGIKALLWQDEDVGREAFKTLGPESDTGFWRESMSHGVKRIGQAAAGRPELACRVNIAA